MNKTKVAYLTTPEGEIGPAPIIKETQTTYHVIYNLPHENGYITGGQAEWPKEKCRTTNEHV